jgi:hypothetical protein
VIAEMLDKIVFLLANNYRDSRRTHDYLRFPSSLKNGRTSTGVPDHQGLFPA